MRQYPTIALDADGVLLDYNLAYASAWERAFGGYPAEKDPNAYWAIDRWDVQRLEGASLDRLRACFDANFWESVPAMPGALEACQGLGAAGYQLVCVTAVADRFAAARLRNLQQLGFPIERVLATGNGKGKGEGGGYVGANALGRRSPKADALQALRPVAFVDDYLPYMVGVAADIHRALILRQPNGSPNVGVGLQTVSSVHGSLGEFARWWVGVK